MDQHEKNVLFQLTQFEKNMSKIYKTGLSVIAIKTEFAKFKRAVSDKKELIDAAKALLVLIEISCFGNCDEQSKLFINSL